MYAAHITMGLQQQRLYERPSGREDGQTYHPQPPRQGHYVCSLSTVLARTPSVSVQVTSEF